ncbi:MAG: orotidine 5'-phosphate decarboxylase, partial [Saccharofermentanales bacterium]
MKNFADRLTDRIKQLNNPTVMGLDPMLSYIPDYLLTEWRNEVPNNMQQASAMAIFDYNRLLIDSVCDIVPAIKPQFAYYEMYGIHGIMALIKTIKYAQDK